MTKLFIDVWPQSHLLSTNEFTEDFIKKLLTLTDVETNIAYDEKDVISLVLLNAADNLKESMNLHEIDGNVGLIYNLSSNYSGWLLIVDAKNMKGSINPLVSKFFTWDRIESQNILTFDELMS